MSNILIATPVLSDAATVTTDSEHANFPATKLQDIQPRRVWRSNGATAAFIEIDLGAVVAFSLISLIAANLTAAGTWRIRTADTQGNLTAAPNYDSTAIVFQSAGWDSVSGFHLIPTEQNEQWVRIDLSDAANPDGYLQAGRVYVSDPWVPAINMNYGWGVRYKDETRKSKTSGGNTSINTGGKYRLIDFTLGFQSESELYDNAFEIDRLSGLSKDILVIPDIENTARLHQQAIYGLMENLQPIVNHNYQLFRKRFRIEELV